MITLEKTRTIINNNKGTGLETETVMKIDLAVFKDGLVAMIQPRNFVVLLIIHSLMGENNCQPTIQQIAERSGLSALTVKKSIKELKEFELVGEL
jgi:hypothetical protein